MTFATLVITACVLAYLGLLWLAQNNLGWAGVAARYIVLFIKWVAIAAITLAVVSGIAYVFSIR